jgi:glycosyltransferase involved in cell wall biosynthesis
MKILYLVSALNTKAPNKLALNLASYMSAIGHSVSVGYFDDQVAVDLARNIRYCKLSFFKPINFKEYDIVHSHMLRADVYAFLRKPFFTSTKFISTFHCNFYSELKNYYSKCIALFIACMWHCCAYRFDGVVVLTEHMKRCFSPFMYKNLVTIHNGVDIKDFDVSNAAIARFIDEKCINVGTYCNLIPRKNVQLLIHLIESYPNIKLIIIGNGPFYDYLYKLVDSKNLLSRILFAGYIENAYLYNKFFDVFAMPSIDEAFGISLIEAALSKKNIVCSDIPTFKEIFDDESVCFFDPNSVLSLYNAIKKVLSSNGYKESAYKLATTRYSNSAMCNAYENFYLSII